MNREATKSATPAPTPTQPSQPAAAAPAVTPVPTPARQSKVVATNLKSSYCNMCSTNSTREEVVLNFGINQDWDLGLQDPVLSLEHRIILSPHLAKRLAQLLNRAVEDYEKRYGTLG
jgi:hypothetical protein